MQGKGLNILCNHEPYGILSLLAAYRRHLRLGRACPGEFPMLSYDTPF